jgi:hypothetical protein
MFNVIEHSKRSIIVDCVATNACAASLPIADQLAGTQMSVTLHEALHC